MAIDIKLEPRDAQHTACVREKVPSPIGDIVGRLIGEVWAALERAGVQPTAGPYARTMWIPGTELEVGFLVAAPFAGDGRVVAGELPAGRAVSAEHVGPYDQLGPVYNALRDWISAEGLTVAGLPWEHYLSDPARTPPAEWRSEVVFPVR